MWADLVAVLAPNEDDIKEGNGMQMPMDYDENRSMMSTMKGDRLAEFPELLSETSHGTAPGLMHSFD
jgi:hypothetical protein